MSNVGTPFTNMVLLGKSSFPSQEFKAFSSLGGIKEEPQLPALGPHRSS